MVVPEPILVYFPPEDDYTYHVIIEAESMRYVIRRRLELGGFDYHRRLGGQRWRWRTYEAAKQTADRINRERERIARQRDGDGHA